MSDRIPAGMRMELSMRRNPTLESEFPGARLTRTRIIVPVADGERLEGRALALAKGGCLMLIDSEHGTGLTNTGHAHIICSPNGEPLKPFVRGWHSMGAPHATFCAHRIASIDYRRWSHPLHEECTITEHEPVVSADGVASIDSILRIRGTTEECAERFLHYATAIAAAVRKAATYHCRDALFCGDSLAR